MIFTHFPKNISLSSLLCESRSRKCIRTLWNGTTLLNDSGFIVQKNFYIPTLYNYVFLRRPEFGFYLKTGTRFHPFFRLYFTISVQVGTKITMAAHPAIRVIPQQRENQYAQWVLLPFGTGVFGLPCAVDMCTEAVWMQSALFWVRTRCRFGNWRPNGWSVLRTVYGNMDAVGTRCLLICGKIIDFVKRSRGKAISWQIRRYFVGNGNLIWNEKGHRVCIYCNCQHAGWWKSRSRTIVTFWIILSFSLTIFNEKALSLFCNWDTTYNGKIYQSLYRFWL